jgi:SAM-dependent methyltransferase
MAKTLSEKYSLNSDSFIIDVAGNDGALLEEFKKVFNPFVLNIDPATNLTAIAEQRGVKSLNKFWNINTSKEVVSNYGKADLITATNVFAHVDNITDFLSSAKEALNDKGVLVLEFPYLIDFIENKEYDTTYFEHLSYVLITPINKLCATLGLSVIDVSKQNIHGGTVRVSISQENAFIIDESVSKFLENESKEGYLNLSKYLNWSKEIENSIKDFSENILNLKLQGYSISAFGASAKGNTLLNSCNINTDVIDYIVDETPEKIGKFSPTTGIPIVNKQMIIDKPTDYMVILAWNFKDEIMNKLKDTYNGKFIIPVPNFSIIP